MTRRFCSTSSAVCPPLRSGASPEVRSTDQGEETIRVTYKTEEEKNLFKKERKIEQNSLAQHWARDWRALALTQERKQITEGRDGK